MRGSILIRAIAGAVGAMPLVAGAVQGCTALKLGSDHALDAGVDPPDDALCKQGHSLPPGKTPGVDDAGGHLDILFAVQRLDYGFNRTSRDDAGNPLFESLGWDLDDTCTGEGQGPSCLEPPWARGTNHADFGGGIDNAFGALASIGFKNVPDNVSTDGTLANTIIRVRGYSGEPDDDQVDVAVYVGFGVVPRAGGDTTLHWDGNDAWMILPDALEPLGDGTPSFDQPKYHDPHAYVTHGVLVAHVPEALVPTYLIPTPSSVLPVNQLVFAGNLVPGVSRWELAQAMTGVRDPVQSVLSYWARTDLDGGLICQSSSEYQSLKSTLCASIDIASGSDSPSAACDGISVGWSFEAEQVTFGGIADAGAEPLQTCPMPVDNDPCDAATPVAPE